MKIVKRRLVGLYCERYSIVRFGVEGIETKYATLGGGMLDTRTDRPIPRNSSDSSIPPSLDQLFGLSLESRAEVVLRHGRLDITRSIDRLRAENLNVPASLADRIAWALAWNIGERDPVSSSSADESCRGLREYRRRWSPDTGWGQIWQSLTRPLGDSNPGSERVLLDELALSVLCEQRESWQPASARPVDFQMANQAFEFIYRCNKEKVIGDIRRSFGERAGRAEEIANEAWARVYCDYWSAESRRRFLGLCRISTLVCQVARYVAIDALREKAGLVAWDDSGADRDEPSGLSLCEVIGVQADPGEEIMMEELRRKLDECMRALTARQQMVAQLIWFEDKAAKSVAEQLRVSEPAVSQHLKKARESVRGCLERNGYRIVQ